MRCGIARAFLRAGRHRHADHPRPHARAGLQRPGRVRHDCRREDSADASRWWPTATSTRPRRRATCCGLHRRRRADDRPRRAGPSLDLSRGRRIFWRRANTWSRPPSIEATSTRWLTEHLHDHYGLYGEESAACARARKHIGWAVRAPARWAKISAQHMNTHGATAKTQLAGADETGSTTSARPTTRCGQPRTKSCLNKKLESNTENESTSRANADEAVRRACPKEACADPRGMERTRCGRNTSAQETDRRLRARQRSKPYFK